MTTRKLTLTAFFIAIILLLAFTPLGFINLGLIKATTVHIPVIIGSLILGPRIGAFLGATFGLTSLVINTLTPSILSFAFSPFIPVFGTQQGSLWAIIIAFVPRMLVGIVPYYVYRFFTSWQQCYPRIKPLALFSAGLVGSLVNTLLVMNLIFLLFQDSYAAIKEVALGTAVYRAVLTVIFVNGVPEAIVAGIATSAVTAVLMNWTMRNTAH